MTRHHATSAGNVAFTAEEEAAWDTMEAEWASGADDRAASHIRDQRNQKLIDTDWTQMPDYNGGDKSAWATYRQSLRDVLAQSGFPNDITWPTEPGA